MKEIFASIREAVGKTPLIKLNNFAPHILDNIFVKCEFMNPGGSVKDRIGFYMIEQAELRGDLQPGGTIVEATAGNTGMGLAMAAAAKGYRMIFVMTTKMSQDKVDLMKACGAEVIVVPYGVAPENPNSFINVAKDIARKTPGGWFADQFDNRDNVMAHYRTTGPELWKQTGGEIDVVVSGIGTGGTLCGIGKFLKEQNSAVKLVMADPEGSILFNYVEGDNALGSPYLIEGIGGDFVPGIADLQLIDSAIRVADEDGVVCITPQKIGFQRGRG